MPPAPAPGSGPGSFAGSSPGSFNASSSGKAPASAPGPDPRPGRFERIAGSLPLGVGDRLGPVFAGEGLKARAMRGSAWTIIGFGAQQVLRLGSNLILTRLLFPEAFGLMALINVVLQGLQMMSDVGISASIVQNKRGDDPEFLQTAWTLQIIRGGLLWLGACALAYPFAVFYEEPELAWMIPVSGLTVLILGFQTTALAQHNRHLQLGRLTMVQLAGQVLNLTVTILLAWHLRSVWALVYGGVSGTLLQVALAQTILPGVKHRLRLDRACVGEIVRFGKWLFLATGLGFLVGQASDKLVLGKLVDKDVLGVYMLAFMLAKMPTSVVNMLMSRVLYPALSQAARDDYQALGKKVARARSLIWQPLLLMAAGLGFFGPLIVETLWDPRYHDAGWMVQLLAIGLWFGGLNSSLNATLLSIGDSFASAMQNVTMLVVGVPAMLIGYHLGQLPGMLVGTAAGPATAHLTMHVLLIRHHITLYRQDLVAHLIAAALAGAVLFLEHFNQGHV